MGFFLPSWQQQVYADEKLHQNTKEAWPQPGSTWKKMMVALVDHPCWFHNWCSAVRNAQEGDSNLIKDFLYLTETVRFKYYTRFHSSRSNNCKCCLHAINLGLET